jgi:urease accessory protein
MKAASHAWLLPLMQTTDSMFPSGSYAHSFGLEGMVQLERVQDPAGLRAFLFGTILPSLERYELPFVAHAFRAGCARDLDRVIDLDEMYGAAKATLELRQASSRFGSQRLAMLIEIAPQPFLAALEMARNEGRLDAHAPVISGVQFALGGSPLEAGLLAVYYQTFASYMTAAMKLIRMGQNACQRLLAELLEPGPEVCRIAGDVPIESAGWFSPILDLASARHESAYTRLFIS